MNILFEIAEKTRERVEQQKSVVSLKEIKEKAEALAEGFDGQFAFYNALSGRGIHLICEVKKASPSKGLIDPVFDYLAIARDYVQGGASAISVLTEPHWFLGSNHYLRDIKSTVSIPVLRKDFTVDDYQIYEAKTLGADAVLLICALMDEDTLRRRIDLAARLGLSALVETHSEAEIDMALRAGARIVGVNNRNLADFSVDVTLSGKFRERVPEDVLFVAESGIQSPQQVRALAEQGVNAVLIGEALMRAEDRPAAVGAFLSRCAV